MNLPLLPEVRCALSDYISARPCSQHSEIFLNTKAPFTPMKRGSESSQIADYFRRASFGNDGRKIGLHSLRATLATELVAENVSYAVTQKILGHVDSSSIQHYVKLDVEMLRSCSIAVPQPSGNFQKMLLAEVSENG